MNVNLKKWLLLIAVTVLVSLPALATTPVVKAVPWDPANPTSPHTAYPAASITMGATVDLLGSADTFTYRWDFGDGNTSGPTLVSNPYDISATHVYPGSTSGQTWTATVTVTDTNTTQSASATYLVIMQPNNLASRVNVAIDKGLWYMHQTMWRTNAPANGQPVNWGGWDYRTGSPGCNSVNGQHYDCDNNYNSGAIDATNVQAFEVAGHVASGPASDPYTDDVSRGIARLFYFLGSSAAASKTYTYNPAAANYGCTSGYPTTTYPNCQAPATQVFYNAGATSCTSPPCTVTFDGNSNGKFVSVINSANYPLYEGGPFMDALVASGTPNAVAPTGGAGVLGQTFQNILQDMVDHQSYCQYPQNYDVSLGYTRGSNASQGGGWWYNCQQGDDNSVSQWAAIGLIGANRGFGLTVPALVRDANSVWVTNSQDVQHPAPTGPNPFASGQDKGAFGYNGSFYYSNAWGPFAVTPSGMVQMALDGVGRTANTAFGGGTNDPDQRWNDTETFYADNFCNNPASGAYYSPRAYTYGMFSFTKSMLLHAPGGGLSPIQYLRTETPNVFSGNPNVPADTIDWYSALSPGNGGQDACDGVAQTLVGRQGADGYWTGHNYTGAQDYFETAWSLIMLKKTVFVSCVNNLYGRGTASGSSVARVDLTWAAQPNATSYSILRGGSNGGPYSQVGTTSGSAYSDTSGLSNGLTYYYVIQPLNNGTEVCQSNQATVTVPAGRGH